MRASNEVGGAVAGGNDSSEVDVLVAVVTYNSADVVEGLLRTLPSGLAGCTWRVVVADNDSKDSTTSVIRESRPDAVLVETGRNAGYSAGINAAVSAGGRSRSVLILNADARLKPESVVPMLRRLRPGVGIVVPRLLDNQNSLGHTLRREPNIPRALGDTILGTRRASRFPRWSEHVTDPDSYGRETRADWAAGTAMLISRECLETCGGWDESFFLYSEETEFCLRARDRGFELVLAPDAEVLHVGGESRSSPTLRALVVVNRIRLYRRGHSIAATSAFWLIAVAREVTRAALGDRVSRQVLVILLNPRRARSVAREAAGLVPDVERRRVLLRETPAGDQTAD